jgi:glutamate 5-kinase
MAYISNNRQRIIIKIGSSLLVDSQHLNLNTPFLNSLVADIHQLHQMNFQVVVVSSGAVALGLTAISANLTNISLPQQQAAAACGQLLLMHAYHQAAMEHKMQVAQILLTRDDIDNDKRCTNAQNTFEQLLSHRIIPIVNENDSVATEELQFGDNDGLAAHLVKMLGVKKLIILTNVDGVYDRDPNDIAAQHIPIVHDATAYLTGAVGKNSLGSGGMYSKLQAAHIAQQAHCNTYIGNGKGANPVLNILNNQVLHTLCTAVKSAQ